MIDLLGEEGALRSVFVSLRYRYVYVNNQKAACSTIKLALYRAELRDLSWTPARSIHRRERSIIPGPAEVGPELFERMAAGEAFRFAVVRNPYVRALSAYRDKLERLNEPDGEVPVVASEANRQRLRESFGVHSDADLERFGFVDFLRALRDQDPTAMDPHWRPQVINTCADAMSFDLIGRVESLEQDLERVSMATGMPALSAEPLNVTRATDALSAYYDREAASLVEDIYRDDFDRFGYPRAVPVA